MRKKYRLSLLMIMVTGGAFAQALNGSYTINSSQPTGNGNYVSFTAFANDINNNGITGPVNVTVIPNSGYNEQVTFTQINGANQANRITIYGNNALIFFNATSSSQAWTIRMNGADYFTFSSLNIQGTGSAAYPALLTAGADYNVFTQCSFSVNANNTSTSGIPVVISGASNTYASYSTSGNNNTFYRCTMFSGYYGISLFGPSNQPYTTGNTIESCTINDYYSAGVYNYAYIDRTTIKSNTIQCPTRTNNGTKYGIYCYGTQNTNVEGNWVRNLFSPSLSGTGSTCYGIYVIYNTESSFTGMYSPSRNRNIIRNNLVTDIRHNGNVTGIYGYYMDGEIYNNTVVLDYASATGGSTRGIDAYGYQGSYVLHVNNNIVHISRSGGGTKYCFYNGSGTTGTDLTLDRNDLFINSPSGANFIGYVTGTATSLAQMQSMGVMSSGFSTNPQFANASAQDYHPTNASINNTAIPMGLIFDQSGMVRNQSTPDIGALEFLTPPCNSVPVNSIAGAGYSLCPGEVANLGVSTLVPDAGITYQWQYSTISNVGPWTQIGGANGLFYNTPPVTSTIYYAVVITCTNPGGGSMTATTQLNVANTVTNSVPYHEGFEGIGKTNRLPNCSWFAPTIGSTLGTYTTSGTNNRISNNGTGFAAFDNAVSGTSYAWTNGIYMLPNITYSASLWFQTDLQGNNNWSSLSIMLGTTQSTVNMTTIATASPAMSPVYRLLSGTYSVSLPGLYYVAVKAVSTSGQAQYLSWDDLDIMIPCQIASNAPSVAASANNATVCAGTAVLLTGSGADTYAWSNGATSATQSQSPTINPTNYAVTGTKTLTGCSATANVLVYVKPSPRITISANPNIACANQHVNIVAAGANTYTWSNNATGAAISVTPSSSSGYTVMGTSALNCPGSANIQLQVRSGPSMTLQVPLTICAGESATMSASGADQYEWISPASFNQANPSVVTPNATTTFTVNGTDQFGCRQTKTFQLAVDPCTGLAETQNSLIRLFPNPADGKVTISAGSADIRDVKVTDVTGRMVGLWEVQDHSAIIDVSGLSDGIYYVHINAGSGSGVIRLLKH